VGNTNIILFAAGVITMVCFYAMNTMALNLKTGVGGVIDFGIVAYVAVGGYTYVLVTHAPPTADSTWRIGLGQPLWVGLIAAPIAAALFSLVIGWPGLRLMRGDAIAITTYAAAEVVRALATNQASITNGVVGFWGLPQPFRSLFSDPEAYSYFFMGLSIFAVVLIYLVLTRLHWSPFSRSLKALRENEDVALSIGKNPMRFRLWAFVLGSAIAGLSGAFYVTYQTVAVPDLFILTVTFTTWIAYVIGGTGNYLGAIVGAVALVSLEEATRFIQASASMATVLAASRNVIIGLALILVIRFMPRGIVPERHPVDKLPGSPTARQVRQEIPAEPATD
jgi:branched-chain amino acid transport system permease protein